VELDLRTVDRERFASVFATLDAAGLDPRRDPVPVAPAAHYMMGGVAADLDGRTSLPGLLAVGECALPRPPLRRPPTNPPRHRRSGDSSRRRRPAARRSGSSPVPCGAPMSWRA